MEGVVGRSISAKAGASLDDIVRDTEESLQRVRLKLGTTKALGHKQAPKSYAGASSTAILTSTRRRPASASASVSSSTKRPSDRAWERAKLTKSLTVSKSSAASNAVRTAASTAASVLSEPISPRTFSKDNERPRKGDNRPTVRFSLDGNESLLHTPFSSSRSASLPEVTPSMIGVLMERLESQQETISLLGAALEKMETRNTNREDNFSHLEKQFESLTERVLERGVDVATETKLARWRESMTRELEKIEERLNRDEEIAEKKGVAALKITALERRMEETRRDAENEKMGMRTLMQNFRRHLSNVETDVTEVLKRQKKIEAKLLELELDIKEATRDRTDKTAEIQFVRQNLSATESKVKDVGKSTKQLKKKVKALKSATASSTSIFPPMRRSDEDILNDAAATWRNLGGGGGGGGGGEEEEREVASSSVSFTSEEEEAEEEKKKKDAKNKKKLKSGLEEVDEDDGAFSDASSDTLSLDASIAAFVTKMAADSAKKWRQKAATNAGGGGGGGGEVGGNRSRSTSPKERKLSFTTSDGEPSSSSPKTL